MSRVKSMPLVSGALPDNTGNAISDMLKMRMLQQTSDNNAKRQAQLDKLAMLREGRLTAQANREEQRYQDTRAREIADRKAATTFIDPITYETTAEERGVFETGAEVQNYDNDAIAKLYNKETAGMTNDQLKDFIFSLQKEPEKQKEIERIKLNEQNLAIESAFNRIDVDPNIIDREAAKNKFLIDNKLYDNSETDGMFKRGLKHTGDILSTPFRYLAKGAANTAGIVSDKWEKDFDRFKNANEKSYEDFYKIDKSSLEIANDRIKTLNKNREKNKLVDKVNNDAKIAAEKLFNKRLDKFKAEGISNQTKIDTKNVPIEFKKILDGINKDAKNRANTINSSKMSQPDKDARLKRLAIERKDTLTRLYKDSDTAEAFKLFKAKEDYKISGKVTIKEVDAKLKAASKQAEEYRKDNTPTAKKKLIKLDEEIKLLKAKRNAL